MSNLDELNSKLEIVESTNVQESEKPSTSGMSGDRPPRRAGRRPGRRGGKMDERAKLERSRLSARECRARKKLRYQYLEDLVANREKAIFALRDELELYKQWCIQIDEGLIPLALLKIAKEDSSEPPDMKASSSDLVVISDEDDESGHSESEANEDVAGTSTSAGEEFPSKSLVKLNEEYVTLPGKAGNMHSGVNSRKAVTKTTRPEAVNMYGTLPGAQGSSSDLVIKASDGGDILKNGTVKFGSLDENLETMSDQQHYSFDDIETFIQQQDTSAMDIFNESKALKKPGLPTIVEEEDI